jgi:hypothetical protein
MPVTADDTFLFVPLIELEQQRARLPEANRRLATMTRMHPSLDASATSQL